MKKWARFRGKWARFCFRGATHALLLAAALSAVACSPNNKPMPDDPLYAPPGQSLGAAVVTGFAWDPEALYWYAGNCIATSPPDQVGNCFAGDVLLLGGFVGSALLGNVTVSLADMDAPTPLTAFPAAAPSADDGGFSVSGVPQRASPPFYPYGSEAQAGKATLAPAPMGFPAVPAAHRYLPTLSLRPIATDAVTLCEFQPAAMISDSGILQALAKTLAVNVADFISPAKYRAVILVWAWVPGVITAIPVDGALVTARDDTSGAAFPAYEIRWAAGSGASPRGYIVNPAGQNLAPPIGLWAIPVPVSAGTHGVKLTLLDQVTDATQGRPFVFPDIAPVHAPAGVITFAGIHAIEEGAPKPFQYLCIP